MTMGNGGPAPFSPPGVATIAGHLGIGAAFNDEEQPLGIKLVLTFKPGLTGCLHIVAILFAGMGGLFLTV
ncbi:hypothetical protein [Labrenzia sp. DG1229]|uniref:hypothetical protein n=1 Tax=Labrenzia sp. DG1229 TaxID=681847 RepID=UPI00048FAB84|nr:hypothetical protein [Labrenzia sp. DG1229]